MAPKKRERDDEVARPGGHDPYKQDHKLFLQAFEKPTQIYRYLRTRGLLSPLFLQRNLTYTRRPSVESNQRSTAPRQKPSVDLILTQVLKTQITSASVPGTYLTISHLGLFYDKADFLPGSVRVEISLSKLSYKRRKEQVSPVITTQFGSCDVAVNPVDDVTASPTVPTSCIPAECFAGQNGGGCSKWLMLCLRVSALQESNGENEEPASKRRKLSRSSTGSSQPPASLSSGEMRAQLPLTDRAGRWLLTDGEYDVILLADDVTTACMTSSPRKASWEAFQDKVSLESFSRHPTLKIRLSWSGERPTPTVNRPRPLQPRDTNQLPDTRRGRGMTVDESQSQVEDTPVTGDTAAVTQPSLLLYHFIYGQAGRRQTQARRDLMCPWCCLNCRHLYPLLKHLQLCHARFSFSYKPIAEGGRIEVAVNDSYDSSYSGNPMHLTRPPTTAAARQQRDGAGVGVGCYRVGPYRRTPSTSLLVCRPRRAKPSLSEFLKADNEEKTRPLVSGHNRVYHRTASNMAIPPSELDYDSEGDHDHPWLRVKTQRMLNEFSDVNDGEKRVMFLWNLHVMKHNFVGDCQMSTALDLFIERHTAMLIQEGLYRNFILHLASLYDFGIINSGHMHRAVQHVQEVVEADAELTALLAKSLLQGS